VIKDVKKRHVSRLREKEREKEKEKDTKKNQDKI